MNEVEHVKIGKHIFPLYSHPLVRAKVQEEAYVEQQIKEQLRNPRLQLAVNEVVEELLKQGITGDVSEEDTAKYIEEALGRLDVFYQAREERRYPTSPSPPPPPLQGLTSSHYSNNNNNNNNMNSNNNSTGTALYNSYTNSSERKTNMGQSTLKDNTVKVVQKLTIPPKRHLAPVVERNHRTLSHSNRSHPLPKLRNVRKQQQQQKEGILSLHKPKEVVECDGKVQRNDVGILYGPVAVPWRRFLPSDMERDDRSELLTTSSQREEEKEKQEFKEEQEESCVSPIPIVKQAPPEWRNAVRSLFYSMISLRVEESGGVQFQEMDLRSSAQRLLKLQGAELDSLSQDAFGALDITMDGNSSAIHCRPKVAPSIIQSSRIQQAEKALKLKPSTLRQQTISALTQSNTNSSTSERYIRVAGASLKHSWLDNSGPLTAATPAESNNQFELPSATYRSRMLGSVLKMKSPR